ncbi:SDR family NAD(P)-dependent oxidoreductase [Geodermatophilus sp. SYSU D01119]
MADELAPLRTLVHCAGRGGALRVVDRDGRPGSLEPYESVVRVDLIGTSTVLRRAAARMAAHEPLGGEERGVCVLTASVAAHEGQVGQLACAPAQAGIVGLPLVAARDLAQRLVRVVTIAPALRHPDPRPALPGGAGLPRAGHPAPAAARSPDEFARLALAIVDDPVLDGGTIRLDGALRMPPR